MTFRSRSEVSQGLADILYMSGLVRAMHKCVCKYIHSCVHACMQTDRHACMHACAFA